MTRAQEHPATTVRNGNGAEAGRVVPMALGERGYDIMIGPDAIANGGEAVREVLRHPRVAIVTDENVAEIHLAALGRSLEAAGVRHERIVVPPGEGSKSFATLETVLERLIELRINRDEGIVALGGGVIGDLTGFAAAILRRGVDFIQVPTTLLAQVDSAVGGKTGINTAHGKNLVGAFYQPRLVLADVTALSSLPRRQLLAGYAEVVKYGLLGDEAFFGWLEQNGEALLDGDVAARVHAVATSCEAKARIVAEDEREQGRRALLNLGHTFGHALEAAMGFSERLLHGEAVAVGMVMAFEFSARAGLAPAADAERVKRHLAAVGLPVAAAAIPGFRETAERLIEHMGQDKKVARGRLTFILTRGIGEAFVTQDVDIGELAGYLRSAIAEPA